MCFALAIFPLGHFLIVNIYLNWDESANSFHAIATFEYFHSIEAVLWVMKTESQSKRELTYYWVPI